MHITLPAEIAVANSKLWARAMIKPALAWTIVICIIVLGSCLGLVLGIIGTIHLWKLFIQWGL